MVFRELSTSDLNDSIEAYRVAISSFSGGSIRLFNEELSEERLHQTYRKIRIERAQRVALPYAIIVMAFIGMSLGIMSPRTQRTWGAGFAGALGVIVFIVYYALYSVCLALADSGAAPIALALWIPNILATGIAGLLLQKLGSEKWQSVSEGILSVIFRTLQTIKVPRRAPS